MAASARRLSSRPFLRFLIGGSLNTVITYAIFLVLSSVLHYVFAFTITFLIGIIVSYGLAGTFVFDTGFHRRSAIRFPFVYVFQYLFGLGALAILIDAFDVSRHAAMLTVIATGIPLNFALQRYAMIPECTPGS